MLARHKQAGLPETMRHAHTSLQTVQTRLCSVAGISQADKVVPASMLPEESYRLPELTMDD